MGNLRFAMTLVGLAPFAAGCGGEADTGNTMTNTASAMTAVSSTAQVRAAVASGNGLQAAAGLQGLGAAAQSIIVQNGAQARVTALTASAAEGSCECSPGGCSFDNCGDSSGLWSLDGSISVDGDTYTFDLSMTLNAFGTMWSWDYDGSITVTDTSINGNLEASGNGSASDPQSGTSVTLSWSWEVSYNGVQLDGQGCPVGGSIDASASYQASTGQGDASFSGSGSVTFGPSCGDAH
jgi:hypothetical protein